MKKPIFFFLLMLSVFIVFTSASFAQTNVFTDDFSTNQSTSWTTSGQIGSSAFYVNRAGDDWGARRNTDPAQLELTNDASATANVAGWVFANAATSGFSSPYNTTLSSNTGVVTWYFNIRQIRTDPAGYAAGNYGAAFILGTTSQTANNTGTGYAIVYGQSGSTDPIRLAKFSGGLSTGLTNIITSNTTGLTDFGAEYISCKVTYDPSNNQWELFLRNDGTSAFADPTTGTLTSQGTATDNTYTSTSLGYMGGYWQGSTAANQTAFFDNITVQVTVSSSPTITLSTSSLTGFTYEYGAGPSTPQSFNASGTNLTANISVAASTNYEISLSSGSGYTSSSLTLTQSGGSVPATPIYVRLKAGLATGTYDESIVASSSGATNKSVACSGSVTSDDYYAGISGTGSVLKAALHTLIKDTHDTVYGYDDLEDQLSITDEDPNNTSNVIQIYTGWSIPKANYGAGNSDWTKEHVWSDSHGINGGSPAYTDLHHLRPLDGTVNSGKSNYDFDYAPDDYIDTTPYTGYPTDTGCDYSSSSSIWEPRDEDKGDVARMMFYMDVRYEGTDTSYDLELSDTLPTSGALYGKKETLLYWHFIDPVDAWEELRNDRIYSLQGNRNPFIDHPEWADSIYGNPDPISHVTDFAAGTPTASSIPLTWTDAAADGYLIKASDVSYAAIVDPVDGVPEENGTLVQNALQGAEARTFYSLSGSTTYYFKIYPYIGSGSLINYHTDPTVPTASATTLATPTAVVALRPTHIDLSSATSESAVKMTLSNYAGNDARFRLYNGGLQYNCWDEVTEAYITSTTYADNPQVPGTPMTSTTFWIMSQRANNDTTYASYRDRLNPYTSNYQTAVLPAATEIINPFTLSGTFSGTETYPVTDKYVVLAYSGTTLVSAASTALSTGALAVVCPTGTTIDKIELRTALDVLIDSKTGSWSTTTDVGTFGGGGTPDPEPAAHVTNFAAGTPTTHAIPLTWTDSATAAGYLIKGSDVSYASIVAPVDTTPEADGALVQNVAQGNQTCTFSGLDANTTYYFKIYPYSNSGSLIDYKVDGTVPQASETTLEESTALLLEENFDYPANDYLHDHGWTAHSGGGTNPPIVSTPGLTYTDYPSISGNCGELTNNGEDVNKTFTEVTTGSVYISFLINVTSATETGSYVFHLSTNPLNTSYFRGKLFFGRDASNNVRFGITKAESDVANAVWTGYDYAYNTTYLVALKYTFVDGDANDTVIAWINPDILSSEPTPMISATVSETDISGGIGSIALRQSNAALTAKFDGFRVATSWTDLFPTGPFISATGTLEPFTAVVGIPSESQSYAVTGSNLTQNIAVTAPTGFQVSLNNSTWDSSVSVPQSGGSANSTVYVRFNPSSSGPYSGNITHTSSGATQVDKAVSGTGYSGAIYVTESLSEFSGLAGVEPTTYQTYHVTGYNLSNFIDIEVSGPFKVRDTTHPSPSWETALYNLSPEFDGDIDVSYWPTEAGEGQTGTITHSDQGSEAEVIVIDLIGNASSPEPSIVVEPETMTFAAKSGNSSAAQMATITAENLTAAITVASTGAYTFSATEGGSFSNPYNITTGYNGTNYFWIKFSPTAQGTFNNTITVTSNSRAVTDTIFATGYGLDPSATYATDLFFSEYIEGSSNNKAIEIFNGMGYPIDLSDYAVYLYTGGSLTPGNSLELTGTLANNDVYVIANSLAIQDILNEADITSSVTFYNGDDALSLWKESTSSYVDIFGRIGEDPGSVWGSSPLVTAEATLIRKSNIIGGVTANPDTLFPTLATEWDGYAQNYIADLGSHTFIPGLTPAAAPVISPDGGLYFSTVTVGMTTTTPGGVIWYTLDGSEPTNGAPSTQYTGSFGVSTTKTVKARTYATGYAPSAISSQTYSFPVEIPDIATLRAQQTGTAYYYKLTGQAVLTLKSTTRNSKYIQDATGAILIDDPDTLITTVYNLGDGITGIIGTLGYYASMLQFTPKADPGTPTSTGNVITPQALSLADLDTTDQAKLVKLSSVTITGTGNFAATTNYPIADADSTGVLRTHYSDLDYIGQPIPTTPKDIVGVILQYYSTMQFIPRSLAEITDPVTGLEAPIVTIYLDEGSLTLGWEAVTGATSYKVYAADDPYASPFPGAWTLLTTTTNLSHVYGGTGNYKFFRVTAAN